MVDQPFSHNRHCLKPPVRVGGETWHGAAVVHAPTVFAAEILADVAPAQRCLRAHVGIGCGVSVVVIRAK